MRIQTATPAPTAESPVTGTSTEAPARATAAVTAPATPICPFAARFGRPLPAGMAAEARGLTWRELVLRFAPSAGDRLHVADWARIPLGRGLAEFQATVAIPGTGPARHRVRATGEFAAMSEMLAEMGLAVECEEFTQLRADDTWVTLLHVGRGRRRTWAMGLGETSARSSIAALASAATLLHLR